MNEINWERVRQEAFTALRRDFTISMLIALEAEGNYTPVSGDSLYKDKGWTS